MDRECVRWTRGAELIAETRANSCELEIEDSRAAAASKYNAGEFHFAVIELRPHLNPMVRPRKPKLRPAPAPRPAPGKAQVISPGLYKDTAKKQEPYSVPTGTKKKEQEG
jgi:hypothetical protein